MARFRGRVVDFMTLGNAREEMVGGERVDKKGRGKEGAKGKDRKRGKDGGRKGGRGRKGGKRERGTGQGGRKREGEGGRKEIMLST